MIPGLRGGERGWEEMQWGRGVPVSVGKMDRMVLY